MSRSFLTLNRTILELKLRSHTEAARRVGSQSHHFGIETRSSGRGYWKLPTLNRTILELKHNNNTPSLQPAKPLNRTILELKLVLVLAWVAYQIALNRTILELKLAFLFLVVCVIVALNRTILELKLAETSLKYRFVNSSQSHHFGIETVGRFFNLSEPNALNRTILELKHGFYHRLTAFNPLSIAPFWN